MNSTTNPVSVSSWALHTLLGRAYPGRPGDPNTAMVADSGSGTLTLLDVPQRLADAGFHTMEICHFHLPTRDSGYLAELRAALTESKVVLWSLLIDDGDITHPQHSERDTKWIAEWLEIAGILGAKCARVIAGKQPPTPETIAISANRLTTLAALGQSIGVRVNTENWFSLLSNPKAVHDLLTTLDGKIGFCLDFGNWGGETKYDDLTTIARYATSCHAKCDFHDGVPDREGYSRCLAITRAVNYQGPYTLVYGEPGGVWESLSLQRELIHRFGETA